MHHKRFKSFLMGGFECSTHKDHRGRRLDLINSTKHDVFAEADYARMRAREMHTARDGVRWHLIEKEPYRYDLSSLEAQISAAKNTGIEIIWDYFHYGYPDDLDIFSAEFIERFAKFSAAMTRYLLEQFETPPLVCPVNEVSFFSWAAGEKGIFYPCAKRRGDELKMQLVKAAARSVEAIRAVCPDAVITFTDPAIHVVARNNTPSAKRAAEAYRQAQFDAFDLLIEGKGGISVTDLVGLNYYFHNQWRHPSRRKIPRGHKDYRPLNEILREYFERYRRPLFIAETGIEDDERADWFRYVCEQTRIAMDSGVPVEGICLYPIVNHPGWADDRHCHNGLWDYADGRGERDIHLPLSEEIRRQAALFS